MGQKKETSCPTCQGKKQFWLHDDDYLECPTCAGTGTLLMYEQIIVPPVISLAPRKV